MRLSQNQIAVIKTILRDADPNGQIYLYGSRVDNSKKGGDIDLFFETSKTMDFKQKIQLERQLRDQLDIKVDLIVKSLTDNDKTIHCVARNGVLL